MAIAVAVIGIPYAFAGYARYDVQNARSGLAPVSYLQNGTTDLNACIKLFASQGSGSIPVLTTDAFTGYYVSFKCF